MYAAVENRGPEVGSCGNAHSRLTALADPLSLFPTVMPEQFWHTQSRGEPTSFPSLADANFRKALAEFRLDLFFHRENSFILYSASFSGLSTDRSLRQQSAANIALLRLQICSYTERPKRPIIFSVINWNVQI
jgi:hypothetical protein